MKQKKPLPFILGYLSIVLAVVASIVVGGLTLSTDHFLPFKYDPYKIPIGISLLLLAVILLAAQVKFMIWGMQQMAANLDVLFGHLGLEAIPHRLNGRHYSGRRRGRRIDIYCRPVKQRHYTGDVKTIRYVGHALDIYVAGNFKTRGSIGRIRDAVGVQDKIRTEMVRHITKKLMEKYGGDILAIDDRRYADFQIYALDPDWMRKFLDDTQVSDSLSVLLSDAVKCSRQHVHIIPAAVHLTTMTSIAYLQPDIAERIVHRVVDLANAAESLPPASVVSEETEAERKSRLGKSMAR